MALTDKLTSIADAIRSKTGNTALLTLDEMPQVIQSIQTGGGGSSETSSADSILDGTIVNFKSDTLTEVKLYGFASCEKLDVFDCPNLEIIGTRAFQYCKPTIFNCPNVVKVSSYVFEWGAPKSVILNKAIDFSISSFANSTNLESIELAEATTLGAKDTFYSSEVFDQCLKLNSVKIPNVTVLGENVFNACKVLSLIDLPSVQKIGRAFQYCEALKTVILRKSTVVTLASNPCFYNTPISSGTGFIYVPKALIEDYKVATNWVVYANQFRAIEDYPEICGGV